MQQLLSISEFGRLTGIDRKALIFYDQIGILHPIMRKENGYRYYSVSQVNELCVLLTLQELGLSLKQIGEIKKKRSAEGMAQLFQQQTPKLEEKIQQILSTMDMIRQRQLHMEECKNPETGKVRIVRQKEQYYYRSDPCSIDKSGSYNETWEQFYEACVAENISQGYPVCYLVSREDILCSQTGRAKHIAFHLGTGVQANYTLPGGIYAAAFFRTANPGPLEYSLMLKAVEEADYQISGDSTEEILFDEVYTADRNNFLTKISFPVKRNKKRDCIPVPKHPAVIDKVAYLFLKDGKILSTRSKGKDKYYLPGGKREGQETDLETLVREIKEELTVDIVADTAKLYGIFEAQAHGKAEGVLVKMTCYTAEYVGELQPNSEIEEITWLTTADMDLISPVDKLIFSDLHEKGLLD